MPGNCHFQIKWLDNPEYKKKRWLDVGSSESKAKGSFGQKEFDISNMGETPIKIHKKF
jgi:hypothetical protein